MSFVHFTSPNSGNLIYTLRWPTSIQGFQSVLHTPKAYIHTMWWCVFRQHWHIDQHSAGMIHICATTACLKIIEPCVERIIGQMLHADQLRLYNNHQTSGTQRTNTTVCMKKKDVWINGQVFIYQASGNKWTVCLSCSSVWWMSSMFENTSNETSVLTCVSYCPSAQGGLKQSFSLCN